MTDNSKDNIIRQAFRFHLAGNISKASIFYEYFLSQGYADPRVFVNYANICNQTNKRKKAIRLYKESIKLFPKNFEAYSNLAAILINFGKLKEAEKYVRKAIEIKPDYPNAYCNLASIFQQLGKLIEAEIYARRALEINPEFVEANSNLSAILIDLGRLNEAEKYARRAIEINPKYYFGHSNLSIILRDKGRFEQAEISIRTSIEINPNNAKSFITLSTILISLEKFNDAKNASLKAIKINPNLGEAYYNLAVINVDLGNLIEAENLLYKALDLNSSVAKSYYILSILRHSYKRKTWQVDVFSDKILENKNNDELVNIYFARANIHNKNKNYKDSMSCLKIANNMKLNARPSNSLSLIKKSKYLYEITNNLSRINYQKKNLFQSIFIVGMPRSGTTLLESILAVNPNTHALGENNILEESFHEFNEYNDYSNLNKIYVSKVIQLINKKTSVINKCLYNYQYAGIIAKHISNVKIIHCFRNPLDNILSIYRAHFAKGNEYSSSFVDSAQVYLDHDNIMSEYKKLFRSTIYDLNYDLLVKNPERIVKDLITWLGWKWNATYLSPHMNIRSVSTASNVQVRAPINSNSVGGWKNYQQILKPAIDIIISSDKYLNLIN